MRELCIRNRQSRLINRALLKRIAVRVAEEALGVADYSLCIHLIGPREMSQLNRRFLKHEGSTDVLTFDHEASDFLYAELFISLDDVCVQARRFHVPWFSELVRCVIHGLLHLQGYEDRKATALRQMKRKENSLLRKVKAEFCLQRLARRPGRKDNP